MPTIHGVNASPFVRKVRAVLEEKGVEYELNPVMPFGVSDEFKKISPLGKIPVYEDSGYVLPDSSCIAAFIERKHPTPALYPENDESFGRALFLEEYADTKLVEVLVMVFVQRVINKLIMKGESDEALCRQVLTERIPPVFDYLESLIGSGNALVDGRFSIADIAVASPFVNFAHAGEEVDAARWPGLAAYVGQLHARPSFKKLIDEEQAGFASM
ncbi:MAG: glutathione S-transferase family protein [Myxococcota bacterium]|nr:glutathione S-transferase family protein [Myxococcota bacterium]